MINIRNLSKEYVSNNKTSHLALNDVSFTLPSRGMIFIIGKSGSGKSTLLNILGGLDSPTAGQIIVDGNDYDNFKEKDFDNYRNTYLGFVFQDFHLIEGLTVQQNITLALDLQGKKNKKAVKEVLKQVDLEGYEKRYPDELSGGQQQRVAIARAIVKKPRLVLADEPTGNLDSKTSKQVLDVLKQLSKNTLVVIVSHNKDDALNYADRIIELSDGQILHDVQRKSKYEFKLIDNKVVNFPHNVKLTAEEIKLINEEVKKGGYTLSQKNDVFTETYKFYEKGKKVKLKPGHIRPKKTLFLANKYTKGQYLNSLFTSLIIGFMVIMIALCQIFSTFDSKTLLKGIIQESNETVMVLQKGMYEGTIYPKLNDKIVCNVEDSDIQKYYDKGYQGNVYKLYNHTIPFTSKSYESNAESMEIHKFNDISDLYINKGRGILECDINFLNKKYGQNGEVKVLAGSLEDDFKPYGVIITDYLADAIIYHTYELRMLPKEEAYKKIIEKPTFLQRVSYKAIIETNYLERYKELVDIFELRYSLDSLDEFNQKFNEIKKKSIFIDYINELNQFLSIGYMINKEGVYDSIMQFPELTVADNMFYNTSYFDENGEKLNLDINVHSITSPIYEYVNDDEVSMGINIYNLLFGTELTETDISQFVPRTITIKRYHFYDKDQENVACEKTLTINRINLNTPNSIILSKNDFALLGKTNIVPYALYFDNIESIISIYDGTSESKDPFYSINENFKTIYKIQDIVIVFNDLFFIIVLVLGFVSIGLLMSFIKRSIESKKYEIGILRAIGGKNIHLYYIFLYQIIMIVGMIFLVSNGGMVILDNYINEIIVNNLARFLISDLIKELVIIEYRPILLGIINGILLILSLISSISILVKLRNIKPINIIKDN